jgi:methyl-accepting chemotaxis protein
VAFQAKTITTQFQAIKVFTNNFVVSGDPSAATSTISRLSFLENAFKNIPATDEKIEPVVKELNALLKAYREAFAKLVENRKLIADLTTEIGESAEVISKGSAAMKAALLSDQTRLEQESNAAIAATERLILMLAIGGFVLGAVWAFMLARGISRPMTAMCKAMRELAGGNFDVVLPGLGRRDELGDMAGAVEEFKVQAIAKAERDTATQEAQNKANAAARRQELIRFADEFETAVGSIVSNVSASAAQLEAAAGTLTRTAETTQSLSSQVADTSGQASSDMQSVAAATEELSASVSEIGRRVRESNDIAVAAVRQAEETDNRIG